MKTTQPRDYIVSKRVFTLDFISSKMKYFQFRESCREKPPKVAKQSYLTDTTKIVNHIVRHYENHPSVRHIKKNVKTTQNSTCSLLTIAEQEVKKTLKKLSTEKSAGVDMIQKNQRELI